MSAFTFTLSLPWYDSATRSKGVASILIKAQRGSRCTYGLGGNLGVPFFNNHTRGENASGSCLFGEKVAQSYLRQAQAVIAFEDTCCVVQSRASPERRLGVDIGHLNTRWQFDHSIVWRSFFDRRYLITTEPYHQHNADVVERFCRERCHAFVTMPPGIGMWSPSSPCGTILVLISPRNNGVGQAALDDMADALRHHPALWGLPQLVRSGPSATADVGVG